jgi:hypothetical protein
MCGGAPTHHPLLTGQGLGGKLGIWTVLDRCIIRYHCHDALLFLKIQVLYAVFVIVFATVNQYKRPVN